MTDLLCGRSGDEGGVSEFRLPVSGVSRFEEDESGIVGKY